MNISFAGCGFQGIYHVGVVSCLTEHAPYLLQNKLSGCSAGSMTAVAVIGGVSPALMAASVLRAAYVARQRTLGPLAPSCNLAHTLHEELAACLPEDIHLKASGRLHVGVTEVWSRDSKIVNNFATKDELIQVIEASSFVPGVSGWVPPVYNGVRVVDGCYSDNRPVLDHRTITVSPFSGNSDICPTDENFNKLYQNDSEKKEISPRKEIDLSAQNIYRGYRTMRASNPERLHGLCKQGFTDALKFLLDKNLIVCDACLVSSELLATEKKEDNTCSACELNDAVCDACLHSSEILEKTKYSHCTACELKRENARVSSLPQDVNDAFEEADDSANNRMSRKLIKLAFLPAKVPLYISGVVLKKVLPTSISSGFMSLYEQL